MIGSSATRSDATRSEWSDQPYPLGGPGEAARQLLTAAAHALGSDGGGAVTGSAYDTAWVARVRDPRTGELAYPRAMRYLLARQAADGSWDGPFPHTVIPTLAALLALRHARAGGPEIPAAAARAERYLREALPRWSVHDHDSVAFEVLVPAMLHELEQSGVVLGLPGRDELMRIHRDKMRRAATERVYGGDSTLLHSLEAFGGDLDFERLRSRRAANGSYGCSPAATAAVLLHGRQWDDAAAAWLERLVELGAGGVPNVHPIDVFEVAWVLWVLQRSGSPLFRDAGGPVVGRLLDWLRSSLTPAGVSISRFGGVPIDSDDTAVVFTVLNRAGDRLSVDALLAFERDDCFACFEEERGRSVSANAHVLEALLTVPDTVLPDRDRPDLRRGVAKATDFLLDTRGRAGLWSDKWHLSPYYATACAGLALADHPDAAVRATLARTASCLVREQFADGGWGSGAESTLEETAYALLLLQCPAVAPGRGVFADRSRWNEAVSRGRRHLRAGLRQYWPDGSGLPALWLGKQLYAPTRVVLATALAALRDQSWRPPGR